jgi:hypothetical protein
MRARAGDQIVDLEGSMLGDVIADMRDDRAGVAGLFFAAFLGSGETETVEIIE